MSRAEQRANEAYPFRKETNGIEWYDGNVTPRTIYREGYEQAERDLALNPTDILKAIRESSIFQEHIFMNGGCYQLYQILKAIFPEANPYIAGYPGCAHIATLINGKLYDIGGCYNSMINFIPLSAEIEEKAREWRFEAMNELYYGECEVCGEPIKIDRSLIGKPIKKDFALTWEDIACINQLHFEVMSEVNPEEVLPHEIHQEVLRRFNEQKNKN